MKLFYILLLLAIPSAIFAQSNYHEGYVLKNNGDTLRGYIDYREWDLTPKSIDFKVNKNDKQAVPFNPDAIKKFEITGMETYISYTGNITMNRNRFPDFPTGLDTSKKTASIFLEQLATGAHITLYYQNDDRKSRFFIAERNDVPVELLYRPYYTNERDVRDNPVYRGQLILYIHKFYQDVARLTGQLEHIRYEQVDLEAIVNEINGNSAGNSNGNSPAKNKQAGTRFFAGLGANITNTKFFGGITNVTITQNGNMGSVVSSYAPPLISRTVAPKISLGIDVFVNPNVQRLIFRAELSFSYVAAQFNYSVLANSVIVNNDYTFNQYTASITPQLILNAYNTDSFKVYIDAGIALNLSGYSNNKIVNPNTGEATANETPYHLEPYWASFPLQTGVVLNKKIEISLTYMAYAAYTQYTGVSLSNQSICLGVKYLLSNH